MTFTESITQCFKKYADFNGTASRSEYWWFFLFLCIVSGIASIISESLSAIWSLATLMPSLAVGARRLHDTDRSGWWQLLYFVPVIGWIALLVFLVQDTRPNRYSSKDDTVIA